MPCLTGHNNKGLNSNSKCDYYHWLPSRKR